MKRLLHIFLCVGIAIIITVSFGPVTYAEDAVVYISDKGSDSNSGKSADAPVKSMRTAYTKLGNGGTVVVCGVTTLAGSDFSLPKAQGKVVITSKYAGVDHLKNGAKLLVNGRVYISGETEFNNISVSATPASMFFCCGNNVTFGENITTAVRGSGSYPYIFGGTFGGKSGATTANSSFFDYTIRVDSGTWQGIRGGNFRENSSNPMGVIGNVTVVINGGTVISTGSGTNNGVVSATSFCGLEGYARLEINGGKINSAIYGIGRPGSCASVLRAAMYGNVDISITDGTVSSKYIAAVQEPDSGALDGNFTLSVTGGNVNPTLVSVSGSGVKGYARVIMNSERLQKKVVDCAKTVFVSHMGDDGNSGLSADKPVKTYQKVKELIAKENGAVIVLCGELTVEYPVTDIDVAPFGISVPSDCLSVESGNIYVTSVTGGNLKLQMPLNVKSNVYFDNITIAAGENSGRLIAYDCDVTVGKNVNTEGEVYLLGSKYESPHTVTVYSGDFETVSGGFNAYSSVVMYGGSAKNLAGTGDIVSGDGASVIVFGGNIGKIYGSQCGCGGDVGIALYGGEAVEIVACNSGEIKGSFGFIAETEKLPLLNSDKIAGNKYFSSAIHTAPEGFEDIGAVTYVTNGGNGDGSSVFAPAPSIREAVKNALNKGEENVSVILLGSYELADAETVLAVPKKLSVGGAACCVNFRYAIGSMLRIGATVNFKSSAVIDELDIVSVTDKAYIAMHGNDITVGNVICEKFFDKGVKYYPSIVGGALEACGNAASITVNSGSWHYVYGGNIRWATTLAPDINGDISVTVNGGEYFGGVYANGMNSLKGNASLTINGGIFRCSIFGTAQASSNVGASASITGNITVTINGGDFRGDILAAHTAGDIRLKGIYELNLLNGSFARVSRIEGTAAFAKGSKAESSLNVDAAIDISSKLTGTVTVENPVALFADPSVCYHNGWYYYTYTSSYNGKPALWMTRAANVADIGSASSVMIWSAAVTGTGSEMYTLWAPQMTYLDGKWYVYATCSIKPNDTNYRKPFVWVGKGDTPFDGFEYHGMVDNCDKQVYTFLSPRVFDYEGKRYLVCGGFYRKEDRVDGKLHKETLIIGELETPTSFKTDMSQISTPTLPWEIDGNIQVQEGPYPLIAPDGTLYIAYAAHSTTGENYCTGLLKYIGGESGSLTDASSWKKQSKPLHQMDPKTGIYSPGAMVFVTEPDGTGTWGIFHVKQFKGAVYSHRVLFVQPVVFVNNLPTMTSPQPTSTTYEMKLNSMPLENRIIGFDKINRLGTPAVTETPESGEAPVDTGVSSEQPPAEKPEDKSNNGVGVILSALCAVALICTAFAVILSAKKKNSKKDGK